MKRLLNSIFVVAMMALIPAITFTSCKEEDNNDQGANVDKTELTALIAECEELANAATTDDYPAEAIETFKSTIAAVKSAANAGNVTQTVINNLLVQLKEAKATFEQSAYDAIPADALLLEYTFDEAGTTQTSTGTQKLVATAMAGPAEVFGSAAQVPQFVEGVKGTAAYLNNGAYFSIDNYTESTFLPQELSISVWVNPEEVRAGNYIISLNYWNNWKFNLQNESKPFFTVATADGVIDADNETVESAPAGKWTHLVVTLSLKNHTLSFYVNGIHTKTWDASGKPALAASALAPAYVPASGQKLPMLIGCATTYEEATSWDWVTLPIQPSGWDNYVGSIDELKVYNIALTAGQISKLYNAEKQ